MFCFGHGLATSTHKVLAGSHCTELLVCLSVQHLGWSAAAFISPTAMLLAGIVFFACSLVNTSGAAAAAAGTNMVQHLSAISPVTAAAGLTETVSSMMSSIKGTGFLPLVDQQQVMWLGLGAGYVTALAASACHNSLFTPCKQMVYKIMPESEVKDSKAVVDLVGGQVRTMQAAVLSVDVCVSMLHLHKSK